MRRMNTPSTEIHQPQTKPRKVIAAPAAPVGLERRRDARFARASLVVGYRGTQRQDHDVVSARWAQGRNDCFGVVTTHDQLVELGTVQIDPHTRGVL